jgi:UDPglucose 6-dehydrogenase
LKEGAAIQDFLFPDRVVVGVRHRDVAEILRTLYAPYLRTDKPFLVMSPESAEMTKYVANAMLATKISFINEMASLCEVAEADIDDVRRGVAHDARIGFAFLFPGVGFGGSSLPRDLRALQMMAQQWGVKPDMLDAVEAINRRQKGALADKILAHFANDVRGKTIALWGLAFKPRTDDIRDAPALALIDQLLAAGAELSVHDPEAMPNTERIYGDTLRYGTQPLDVLVGADALAINTDWGEFRNPDFAEMRKRMAQSVIFDGRNLYDPRQLAAAGFTYYSVGRPTVRP